MLKAEFSDPVYTSMATRWSIRIGTMLIGDIVRYDSEGHPSTWRWHNPMRSPALQYLENRVWNDLTELVMAFTIRYDAAFKNLFWGPFPEVFQPSILELQTIKHYIRSDTKDTKEGVCASTPK